MINTDATVAAIRDSLRLVKRHPIVLTPQIIFVCLLAVWEYLFPPWEPSGIPIPFIEVYSWPPNVIPLLAQLIVYSMYPLMIKSELSGNGLGIKGSAVKTLRKIPPLVTGSVLIIGITLGPFYVVLGVYTWICIEEFFPVSVVTSSLLVWVGIVVSVVWAVISFRWYAYAIQAITINDVGPVGGLRRSKKFVKERKPPFFILLLLIFAIIILISLIASVPIFGEVNGSCICDSNRTRLCNVSDSISILLCLHAPFESFFSSRTNS